MKRLNPETGEPFRYGDTRADGKVFRQYQRTIDKQGFFHERWVSPDTNKRYIKAANYKRNYGLSIADHGRLLEAQSGRCWVCERDETDAGTLAIDHCHATGEVRGLLCQPCNLALGHIEKVGNVQRIAERLATYHATKPAQTILTCGET